VRLLLPVPPTELAAGFGREASPYRTRGADSPHERRVPGSHIRTADRKAGSDQGHALQVWGILVGCD